MHYAKYTDFRCVAIKIAVFEGFRYREKAPLE